MKGIYIVIGANGLIYGAYDSDEAAKECLKHVCEDPSGNRKPIIRYLVLNNNYWDNKS